MEPAPSSPPAATPPPPASIEPPGPGPSRPGPRSPAWPLGHKPSCDWPSCALSRPEPIKLTVPLEIGTYRALIGLAERAGDRATHRLAESILAQELEMAGWLEANLARIAAENLPAAEAALNSFRLPFPGGPSLVMSL